MIQITGTSEGGVGRGSTLFRWAKVYLFFLGVLFNTRYGETCHRRKASIGPHGDAIRSGLKTRNKKEGFVEELINGVCGGKETGDVVNPAPLPCGV